MQFRYFELSFRHFEKISKFRNFDKNSFLLLLKSCQNAGTAFCNETDDILLFLASFESQIKKVMVFVNSFEHMLEAKVLDKNQH